MHGAVRGKPFSAEQAGASTGQCVTLDKARHPLASVNSSSGERWNSLSRLRKAGNLRTWDKDREGPALGTNLTFPGVSVCLLISLSVSYSVPCSGGVGREMCNFLKSGKSL